MRAEREGEALIKLLQPKPLAQECAPRGDTTRKQFEFSPWLKAPNSPTPVHSRGSGLVKKAEGWGG